MAEEWLEVRIYVRLTILWVAEEVETSAVVHICIFELELNLVRILRTQHICGQVDSMVFKLQLAWQRHLFIDFNAGDFFSLKVKK